MSRKSQGPDCWPGFSRKVYIAGLLSNRLAWTAIALRIFVPRSGCVVIWNLCNRRFKKGLTVTFYTHDNKPMEVNAATFKDILLGGVVGYHPGLTQVVLNDGRIEWLKAADQDILKAVVAPG